jgi:hypothetical protein
MVVSGGKFGERECGRKMRKNGKKDRGGVNMLALN